MCRKKSLRDEGSPVAISKVGSVGLRAALSAAVLVSFAATASAQDFPPFPEPAIGPFPNTEKMTLLSQLLPEDIGAVTPRSGVLLNDIWGWTSPNGEEYALIGTGDGMSIVRVTDPANPQFIGQVPTTQPASVANLWGDVGVFDAGRTDENDGSYTGYAYYTTEAEGVGINILELNQLDDMGPAPDSSFKIMPTSVFEEGGYASAHNVYVNQATGFAYVVGAELEGAETACDDEPFHPSRFNTLILDLNPDPLNPEIVACMADFGEHDIYVVNYQGPDTDYQGREIAFVFDGRDKDAPSRRGLREDDTPGEIVGGTTEIWDVTDKTNIQIIASFTVPGICFSHAGWTASNRHEYLLINDELDELRDAEPEGGFFRTNFCGTDTPGGTISNPGVYVVNVQDLDNPVLQERVAGESPGDNDHNSVRRGNKLYWAVYNAGTRVIKMQHKKDGLQLEEIARLDSEPRMPPPFNGQWGIFPFESSETVVASDIVNGLMVMRLGNEDDGDDALTIATTRATSTATAASAAASVGVTKVELLDLLR
jgi:choice-of-anchor B domain-containing protein